MYNMYANHIYTIVYAFTKPFIYIIYFQLIVLANRVVHIMCLKTEKIILKKKVSPKFEIYFICDMSVQELSFTVFVICRARS